MTPVPLVIPLRGTVNTEESRAFEKAILAAVAAEARPIIIHCEELEYLNSHAAGVFVHVHQILARANLGLYLVAPPPGVLYVLERAGLASILCILESEDAARAAIAGEN